MSCGRTRRCAVCSTRPSPIQARPMAQILPGEPLAVSKSRAMAVAPATASSGGIARSTSMSSTADQLQPLVFAEHRHAMLLRLGQLGAGARAGHDVIGLLR